MENITDKVIKIIEELKAENGNLILSLVDYEIHKASSGGEIRINRLQSYLSKYYKILLICLNDNGIVEETKINNNFIQLSIPKTKEHLIEQKRINDKYTVSANDIITSYMCDKNDDLVNACGIALSEAFIVILSHPYMYSILPENLNIPVIYDSHNYETQLKKNILKGHPDYDMLTAICEEKENNVLNISETVICCAQEEYEYFKTKHKAVFLVENGVDIHEEKDEDNLYKTKMLFNDHICCLFIGSDHKPNTESAEFIINTLAKQLNFVYFFILGSVCDSIEHLRIPKNVILFGRVDDDVKNAVMKLADIAVNPMMEGAGSNLKLADYFSHKIPSITTVTGSRGYNIKNENEAIVCSLNEFAYYIEELAGSIELYEKIKINAYNYALRYLNWVLLADRFYKIINRSI